MAKSLRSKRKMRLRSIKRDIAEPHYEKKEMEKLAKLAAAAEAPKVIVRKPPSSSTDVEMTSSRPESLKPNKKIGKKKRGGKKHKRLKKL